MTVTMNALSLIANDLITSLQSPSSSGLARGLSRRDDGHSSYPATSNIRQVRHADDECAFPRLQALRHPPLEVLQNQVEESRRWPTADLVILR